MVDIECEICCTCFDESSRRPRILTCGHTFCASCLKLLLKDKCIICPNCQRRHAVDDVDNLLVNYIVGNLLRSSDSRGNNTKTSNKCEEHGYDLNFFCKKHAKWICRDCTVIDHKPHSKTENCTSQNPLQCSTECLSREGCHVLSKKKFLELKRHDMLHHVDTEKEKMHAELGGKYQECLQDIESKLKLCEDIKIRLIQYSKENDHEVKVLKEKRELIELIPFDIKTKDSLLEAIKATINDTVSIEELASVEETASNEFKDIWNWIEEQKCQLEQTKSNANKVEIKWKEVDMYQSEIKDLNKHLQEKNDSIKHLESLLRLKDLQINHVKLLVLGERLRSPKLRMSEENIGLELKSVLEEKNKIIKDSKSTIEKLEAQVEERENDPNWTTFEGDEQEYDSKEGEKVCEEELQVVYDSLVKLLHAVSSVTPQNVHAIKKYLGTAGAQAVYLTTDKCFDCRTINRGYGKLSIENDRLILNEMTDKNPPAKSIILQVYRTGARLPDGWVEVKDGEHLSYVNENCRNILQRERPPAFYVCPMKQLLEPCKDVFLTLKVLKQYNDNKQVANCVRDPLTVLHINLFEGPDLDKFRKEAFIRSCCSYAGETWENLTIHSIKFPHDAPNDDGEMINCILPPTYGLDYGDRNYRPFMVRQGEVYGYDKGGFSICVCDDLNKMTKQVLLGCVKSDYMLIKNAVDKYGVKNIEFGRTYVSLDYQV